MPDTDPASAVLAAIRERAKAAADFPLAEIAAFTGPDTKSIGGWVAASALDVPSLLAAVEAVLKLADEIDNGGRTRSPVARASARILRERVRAALSGEEASDG